MRLLPGLVPMPAGTSVASHEAPIDVDGEPEVTYAAPREAAAPEAEGEVVDV